MLGVGALRGLKEAKLSKSSGSKVPDSLWEDNLPVVRRYLDQRQSYERLAREVAYILEKKLNSAQLEIAAITNRPKELDSFLEKLSRKAYVDPFTEIEDFAGVRVVYLYATDFPAICTCVEEEFDVVRTVDKLQEKGDDRFGYLAVHFIVKLGKRASGARYDDIKDLVCEVQLRTVLQDAWAIINHHLIYKRERDIPTVLKRKFNSIAGLFEMADEQFDTLRREREKYVANVDESQKDEKVFLSQEVNADTIAAFLKWKYPDMEAFNRTEHRAAIMEDFPQDQISTLADVNRLLTMNEAAIAAYCKEVGKPKWSGVLLAVAIALVDENYRSKGWEEDTRVVLDRLARKRGT